MSISSSSATPDITEYELLQRSGSSCCPAFAEDCTCSGSPLIAGGSASRSAHCRRRVPVAFLDWTDRGTAVLFRRRRGRHRYRAEDHRHLHLLYFLTASQDSTPCATTHPAAQMRGNEVFKPRTLSKLGRDVVAKEAGGRAQRHPLFGSAPGELRIIQSAADKLGLPMEKVVVYCAGSRQHVRSSFRSPSTRPCATGASIALRDRHCRVVVRY